TGKFGDLAGFTSAVILAGIACMIGVQSAGRLASPVAIRFDEALFVAVIGLIVDLLSPVLLMAPPHAHPHAQGEEHAHAALNLRSAYVHVLADALTSVFAIAALCAGKWLGWRWTDPAIGIVGALMILRWSVTLARDAAAVLLDVAPNPALAADIKTRIE